VTYENNNYTATFQHTLTYELEKEKHHLNLLLGAEQVNSVFENFSASRQGYALETIDYAYLAAGSTNKDNDGSGGGFALLSYFAKANYDYAGKYLASVTVRRDGSSRFGPNNRYGYFPAFSLGWRLSEEAFIRDHVPVIKDLKIRYGWGKAGNQEIANNAIYTIYTANYGTDPTWNYDAGSAYDINGAGSGQLPSGFSSTQTGNPSLKWESSIQSNIGVDFTLFGSHISGSVDYFTKNASDILILPPPIAVLGEGGYEYQNGASMDNKGFEALLSYDGKLGNDLRFGVSANIATYRNKVVYLPSSVLTAYPGNGRDKTILNHSINSYFGYVANGLFTSQKDLDQSATQVGKALGRIRYKDLNGDGIIDVNDQDYIGTADPKFTYGINLTASWHNLDLACFFQGVAGVMVNNSNKVYTDFSSLWPGVNWGKRTLQAWTPSNPKSTIPALTLLDANNEGRFSTYFIEPGSYLKLRNLELGYTFKQVSNRWKIKQFRVFVMGNNIWTIKNSRYTGPDPEIPNSGYPMPAIYTVGLNASL
jgi:TonB-linked SusC/RagA family outer membrane protein